MAGENGLWDAEVNSSMGQHYDNIGSAITGTAVAAAVDLGASIWNSTAGLLGADEVNTYDLLSRLDQNALAAYTENPDTVQAASFIGGVFLPAGLMLKGMGLARAGVKGFGYFSEAGRVSQLEKIDAAFKAGSNATKEYNALRRQFFLRGQVNNLVDNAAMEGAILATMNAHPYMEDYLKDPGENFLTSMAFGGVIGGAATHIADRFAVNALKGAANKEAFDTLFENYKPFHEGFSNITKLQVRQENIKTLTSLATFESSSPIVKEFADKFLSAEKAAQELEFKALSGKLLQGASKEEQEIILNRLASDPRLAGPDKIELWTMTAQKAGTKPTYKQVGVTSSTEFDFKNFFDDKLALKSRVFIPETGALTSTAEAAYLTRASVLGETPKTIAATRSFGPSIIFKPDNEAGQNLFFSRTPEIDRTFLQRLDQIQHLKPEAIAKASIAPDDLPTLNALVSWGMKNPDKIQALKIRVTREEPNYDAISKIVFKEAGVKADHLDQIKALSEGDNFSTHSFLQGASIGVQDLTRRWLAGTGMKRMQDAFQQYFRPSMYHNVSDDAKFAKEIYESPASVAYRDQLRKIADADGNVYLYRGLRSKPMGSNSVESFTSTPDKAKLHGKTHLFKVNVDDVIGLMRDIPDKDGVRRTEILVGSPSRQTQVSLPVSTATSPGVVETITSSVKQLTFPELSALLVQQKEDILKSLLQQGTPIESAAIRTNTPIPTVLKFWEGSGSKSLMDLDFEGFPYMHYTDADRIDSYLAASQRPLLLQGNKAKVPYTELSAKADVRALDLADRQIKSTFIEQSNSAIAKEVGALFFSDENRPLLDMLRAGLSNAVPGKAGYRFFQSLDSYSSEMGDFGKIASYMGKQITHVVNKTVSRILTPISEASSRLVNNPAAHVEFQTAIALNASLKGQRVYQDRRFWTPVEVIRDGKKVKELQPATFQGKEFRVVTKEADELLSVFGTTGREFYEFQNTVNKILGKKPLTDLGYWVPAFNPIGKHIAYVHDVLTDNTKILFASTADELNEVISVFESANLRSIAAKELKVIRKGEQEYYNLLAGRVDPLHTEVANVSMQHGGSSTPGIVKANVDTLSDMVQAYEHYTNASIRRLADISMSDITGNLDRMAEFFDLPLKNQPLTAIQRFLERKENPAAIMRNALLGASNADQAPMPWKFANQTFEFVMGTAQKTLSSAWRTVTENLPTKVKSSSDLLHRIDYETLNKKLEAEGIFNPWKAFDDKAAEVFQVAQLTQARNTTARTIHASNALAATAVLRFGDVAQPLVNAMSLPILMSSAVRDRMPATFMGAKLGTAKVGPLQAMQEGIRAMNSTDAQFTRWSKRWEEAGYFKPIVSEASDALALGRKFEPGVVAATERALSGKLVEVMASGADYSEALVRKTAMFTGGALAKRLYPELDDLGVTIFARDFMDKVVGNYHAAQRPTMFQGTLGVAASLFQTYMLTLGQRIYRHLQLKDYKTLGVMALTQSSIFGMGSLPGFNLISKAIGEHYSDDNVDLTTGTFRALPGGAANILLYGLPSSMGPAFYSRGEISPRAPTTLGELPAFSILQQGVQSIGHVIKSVAEQDEGMASALGQALSMQSVNRPIARLSETLTGYSTTRQGSTISTPEEVWTPLGIFSRLLATRPLEEAKLRDAIHLDRYYGAIDHEERQEAIIALKQSIRSGSLTDEKLGEIAEKYLRTGSPQGWRAAVNQATHTTEMSGASTFMLKLKPDNPLMYMIDNLDGEE